MYSLTSQLSIRRLLSEQLPAIAVSMVLAELFYKFHSFTLECLAFLATWFAVDASAVALRKVWKSRHVEPAKVIRD
jgi:hypothetical protein